MDNTVTVQADFLEDARQYAIGELSRLGIKLPDGSNAHLACLEYFHQLRRRVHARPRRVFWSNELRSQTLTVDEQQAIDQIARELETGADITPRLSKSIKRTVAGTKRAGSYDGALIEWGVHHLHIGTTLDADRSRSRLLLFVLINDDSARLVALRKHGTQSFADQTLLEILHRNWPDVISHWLAPGVVPGSLSPQLDPVQRRKMRQTFTMGTMTQDGTVYLPASGGIVTSGHSSEAVQQANALLNRVHPAEVWVRENAVWVRNQISQRTNLPLDVLRMQFCTAPTLRSGQTTVCEIATDIFFHPVPPMSAAAPMIGRRVRASDVKP